MQQILFDFIGKYISLNEEEKEAIAALDLFRTEKKGSIVLQKGTHTANSFFVLQGCLRTYYTIDGEEKTTSFYTEMEGITPHCVNTGQPSEYYIACVEDCVLSVSNAGMEAEMFEKFPRFETLCRKLSEELVAKQQLDFDAFKTSSPEERYLHLLEHRPDLIRRIPQHQLASFLGITAPSLSRLRARIAKQGGIL